MINDKDRLAKFHIYLTHRFNRTKMETPELISSAQAGNLLAFNRLIHEYQDSMHSLIYYLCPGQDVEALMQTAVWQIYRRLPGYHTQDVRLWLIKIIVKVCRQDQPPFWSKIIRSGNGRKPHQPISELSSPSNHNRSESIGTTHIHSCISSLESDLRTVLVLIDLEKLDYSQAAAVLGIPKDSVRIHLAKARWQLSKHLNVLQKD